MSTKLCGAVLALAVLGGSTAATAAAPPGRDSYFGVTALFTAAPDTVAAGSVARFQVTLVNTTGKPLKNLKAGVAYAFDIPPNSIPNSRTNAAKAPNFVSMKPSVKFMPGSQKKLWFVELDKRPFTRYDISVRIPAHVPENPPPGAPPGRLPAAYCLQILVGEFESANNAYWVKLPDPACPTYQK